MSDSVNCYHCNLPVPKSIDYSVLIEDQLRPMCCPGCRAVAQTIIDSGLIDYYRYRTEPANKPDDLIPDQLKKLELFDEPELQNGFVRHEVIDDINSSQTTLLIEGITCAACSWLIERQLNKIKGVVDATVNLTTHQAVVTWNEGLVKLSQLLKKITVLGYNAQPYHAQQQEAQQKKEFTAAMKRLAVAGFGMMQVMSYAAALYLGAFKGMALEYQEFFRWVSFIVTTPIFFYSGRPFFSSAWRSLKIKKLVMDFPISLAIGSAYFTSVFATLSSRGEIYFDSVSMFIFFLTLGRLLEMVARHRSIRSSSRLQDATPQSATLLLDNIHKTVPAYKLQPGDKVLVKPGEIIPADGLIIEGESSVSEAVLTGESFPIIKKVGDPLIGGSQNSENPLIIEVTRSTDKSVLSHIIKLIENAQRQKPPIVNLTNRIAGWFVGFVLLFALCVAIVWFQINPESAFWITLSVLVITCPCALSLATPTALTATLNALTNRGFLVSRSQAIDGLRTATDVVFDKTGTLTHGDFYISEIRTFSKSETEVVSIAAALEQGSEHPLARAFLHYAESKSILPENVTQLTNSVNRGLEGLLDNRKYRIGCSDYVSELFKLKNSQPLTKTIQSPDHDGLWILLGSREGPTAWFKLVDKTREEVPLLIPELKRLGLTITLLSGDSSSSPVQLANELNIPHVISGATPTKKMEIIKRMQKEGSRVIMVGDGVNDAPVLAAAQTSIAMGNASTLAKTNADAILFGDNLSSLIFGIKIARRSARIIKQNLGWAILYNLIALPLAAMGYVAPYWAALGMSVSSLLVVLNALRLTRGKRSV